MSAVSSAQFSIRTLTTKVSNFDSSVEKNLKKSIMSLDEKFNTAAAAVKDMKSRPSDSELLELYALYKQATVGDCNIDQPGALDLKAKAKYEAWNGKKGMSQDAAKEAYVTCANALTTKY